jgi:hypothetical protein
MEIISSNLIFQNSYNIENIIIESEILDLLKCYLCNKICKNAVVLTCCDSLSCETCIIKYAKSTMVCHNCKGSIKFKEPSSIVTQTFDSIKMNCIYGCKELLNFKSFETHEIYCKLNPEALYKCIKCDLSFKKEKNESHDCTNELKFKLNELQTKLEMNKDSLKIFDKIKNSLR